MTPHILIALVHEQTAIDGIHAIEALLHPGHS